jgi:hypothetical protein
MGNGYCNCGLLLDVGATMSDEFKERAALEGALDKCRALVDRIVRELRNKKSEHFVNKLALADFLASLEYAVRVLEQKSRDNRRTPTVKRSEGRSRQRHR